MNEMKPGEIATIHGKMVLCAKVPKIVTRPHEIDNFLQAACLACAFNGMGGDKCPPCSYKERTDNEDVYYPPILNGICTSTNTAS